MKQAPQSREARLAGSFGPQQRGNHVSRDRALGLREIDQQRKPLAQVQLDRAVISVDLREPERSKQKGRHGDPLPSRRPPGDAQGTVRRYESGQIEPDRQRAVRAPACGTASIGTIGKNMFARLAILLYAIVSYGVFTLSFLYALGFVGNYVVPKSIDVGSHTNLSEAIVVNLLLLVLFAIQHSAMARPSFKRWMTKFLPAASQRSTYVLLSSLILLLLFWQWRPIPTPVWQIGGIAAWLLIASIGSAG
ncbi:hypothetical protein ACVWZZ_000830 [Bradyrhizobium sp. LM6.10]